MLAADLSRDGRTIVFDLLGELWSLDATGGEARPFTDAVRDTAEDLDPSLSPDGTQVVFSGERAGRRGALARGPGGRRAAAPLADAGRRGLRRPGRVVARRPHDRVRARRHEGRGRGGHGVERDRAPRRRVRGGADAHDRGRAGAPTYGPRVVAGRRRIAFVNAWVQNGRGGRAWSAPVGGGAATPLIPEGSAPWRPRSRRTARTSRTSRAIRRNDCRCGSRISTPGRRPGRANGTPSATAAADQRDVAATRVRWTPRGTRSSTRRTADSGGPGRGRSGDRDPVRRDAHVHAPARRSPAGPVPGAGRRPAGARPHGTRDLAGRHAGRGDRARQDLGRADRGNPPVFGEPRAVADVPHTAVGLAWSPDESEIAFAVGPLEHEDLYAADVASGEMRRVTELEGGEREPLWSPDGRASPSSTRRGRVPLARRRGPCAHRLRPRRYGGPRRGAATWEGRPRTSPCGIPTRAPSSSA